MILVKRLSSPLAAGSAALVMVLMAMMLAGCGGGDDGASGAEGGSIKTSTLSKEQFIKRADEICTRESEEFLTLLLSYMNHHKRPNQSEAEAAAVGVQQVLLPRFRKEIREIRDLGAPAGDEEEIEAFLDTLQQEIVAVERLHSLSLQTQLDREFERSRKLAAAYGMESCI